MNNILLESVGRSLKRVIEYGFKNKYHYKIPFFIKLKYAILGYAADEYVYNDFVHNNYKEYLSYYECYRSYRINGIYTPIFDNKLIFEEIARQYIRVPVNYAYISNGNIYGLKNYKINNNNVIDFIKSVRICTFKLLSGNCGKGFLLIKHIKDDEFDINGNKCYSKDIIKQILKNDLEGLLTEYMHQSEFSASLFSKSANTIRLVCAKKKNEPNFSIIAARQRIGTEKSKPVDNYAAGGIACEININTGELGYARISKASDIKSCIAKYEKHPDTNVQIKGQIVPNWHQLKDDILTFVNKFPYLKIVGLDVLLTESGFCVIECNCGSCLNLLQIEGGHRYKEMGDIYRSYGIFNVNNIKIER